MYAKHKKFVTWYMNREDWCDNKYGNFIEYIKTIQQKDREKLKDVRTELSKSLTFGYKYRGDIGYTDIYRRTLNLHHGISNILLRSDGDDTLEAYDMRDEVIRSRREYEDGYP